MAMHGTHVAPISPPPLPRPSIARSLSLSETQSEEGKIHTWPQFCFVIWDKSVDCNLHQPQLVQLPPSPFPFLCPPPPLSPFPFLCPPPLSPISSKSLKHACFHSVSLPSCWYLDEPKTKYLFLIGANPSYRMMVIRKDETDIYI